MPRKKTTTATIDFETSLTKLNQLVEKMERGNVPLEQSLQYYEEGVTLVRQCQQALSAAEQKIAILTTSGDKETLEPYQPEESDDY